MPGDMAISELDRLATLFFNAASKRGDFSSEKAGAVRKTQANAKANPTINNLEVFDIVFLLFFNFELSFKYKVSSRRPR